MTEDLRNSIISELRCNNICAQASDNHILIQTTIENIDLELRCEFNEAFPYETRFLQCPTSTPMVQSVFLMRGLP